MLCGREFKDSHSLPTRCHLQGSLAFTLNGAARWSCLIMPNGKARSPLMRPRSIHPARLASRAMSTITGWMFFGAAALGTLINIGVATTEDQPTLTYSGIGIASNYDPVSDALRDGVQRTGSIVTNRGLTAA